ncbi:uncharacterized protein LOC129231018 [Uloborus diversus]|uniref:uncharacterized protein LOC129231018 n=1 Tax=Uloborus diversus TaxID=327109 RepID=UPI002409CA9F|nr:uncharacterized protein LOC129231018 [Uloborus diversus]
MENTRCFKPWLLITVLCHCYVLIPQTASVVVSNITLLTESNRTDYVLQGEAAFLHCNYQTSPDETLSSVRWEWTRRGSDERTEVYVWRPGRRPVAKEIFFGRTDISNTDPSVIIIRSAHMEMEGKYRCLVQTNQPPVEHTEFQLIVIVDACRENVWSTKLNNCSETIRMNCVGLFPKPSASCGVYDEDKREFVINYPFDRIVTLRNHTYEVTLTKHYEISNWTDYKNITFTCYFVIDGTSWRRGIKYRLFGDYGCDPEPPLPGPGTYNMSEEKSCWNRARQGAIVHYSCNRTKILRGPDTLICKNGSWLPENPLWTGPMKPYCNSAQQMKLNVTKWISFVVVIVTQVLFNLRK